MEDFLVTFVMPYSILWLACWSLENKHYLTALFGFGAFLGMLIYTI